jgi:hypothetical protein
MNTTSTTTTPTTTEETLIFLRGVSACATRAAEYTGREHDLQHIQEVIHGLGHSVWMTGEQNTLLCLARALRNGCTHYLGAPIGRLSGVRTDGVLAAILCHDHDFRTNFQERLGFMFPDTSLSGLWRRIILANFAPPGGAP